MLRIVRKAVLVALTACMLLACASGMADSIHQEIENPAFDMEVTVGYEGVMTYGKTMPVRVRIRNFGDDFEGILAMNAHMNNKEYDRYEKTVAIPAGSSREFELNISVFSKQNEFTAELVQDGKTICAVNGKPKTVINPSAMLVGVLSTRPQNLRNLDITRENDTLARYEYWQTISLTKDNFPEEVNALKSFGMLVIDDFDPSTLSEKQQKTLDDWLRSGRILLCGGGANAARNAAFFSGYTKLTLKQVTTSDNVLAGLEHAIARKESGKQVSAALAEYSGANPLYTDKEYRGLIWRSAAGAGRIYTAAFETGDPRLNSESLMHYFWQQLLVDQDSELYSSVVYSNSRNDSNNFVNASGYLAVQAQSLLLPALAIVAGMLVLACLLWWILKKKDLRQWMWMALPVLSVLAVGSLLLLSAGSETNRPLAVIAENMVQDAGGVIRNYSEAVVAVPSYGLHRYSIAGENLQVQRYDYVDYDEEDEKNKEPMNLRTCYSAGGDSALSVESLTPWQRTELTAEADPHIQGRITGWVWMEEDGLHGEIVNKTDQAMADGKMITTYGFASVPALKPGEKAEVLLKEAKFKDPQMPEYEDGFMYLESRGLYSVADAAVGLGGSTIRDNSPKEQEMEAFSAMITNAADTLRRGQPGLSYGAYESTVFLYSAKPEGRESAKLTVDGKPVEKAAATALLTAELSYLTMGRTGVVFRSAGMDIPERVETDDALMPTGKPMQSRNDYYFHQLIDNPTFLYKLQDMEGVRVNKLQVVQYTGYEQQTVAYALNVEKQQWEKIPLNESVPNPEKYVDKDGKLYLQFRLDGGEEYADMSTPMIILEGRKGNAED